jgi:putative Holliday junction resolvase
VHDSNVIRTSSRPDPDVIRARTAPDSGYHRGMEEIGRTLGVDFGSRRIGLAISDTQGTFAGPLKMLPVGPSMDGIHAQIAKLAAEEGIVRIVVGLPLNMHDGSEGPQAKLTRVFGDELAKRAGVPVEYFDERLTSFAAESLLRDRDLTRGKKKARVDMLAAQMILEGWLEARRGR